MRKVIGFVTLLLMFTACNLNGSTDKYAVEGTVKNSSAKSITLEKLGLQKVTVVDSSKIDDKGFFKMAGVSEKGFYRLKLDEKTFFLFLLGPAQFKCNLDAQNPQAVTITGYPENDEFQGALKNVSNVQREFGGWNQAYQQMMQMGASQDTMAFISQQLQAAAGKFEAMIKDSSRLTKSPLVGMFYVTNAQLDKFPKENLAVIQRMEKEIPNSSYTKELREVYTKYETAAKTQGQAKNAAEAIGVGKVAPDIDLADPNGKNIKLSSLKGKVVLLDFWASWCGPCRMEMPNVVAAYKKYKDKGFTVYSVSLDKDASSWKNAIGALGMVWENHVSDLKWWQSEAAVRYGIQGIPAAFLLDKNGVIVATNLRGEALDQKVAELVK